MPKLSKHHARGPHLRPTMFAVLLRDPASFWHLATLSSDKAKANPMDVTFQSVANPDPFAPRSSCDFFAGLVS